jgi:hypothetical protein
MMFRTNREDTPHANSQRLFGWTPVPAWRSL